MKERGETSPDHHHHHRFGFKDPAAILLMTSVNERDNTISNENMKE